MVEFNVKHPQKWFHGLYFINSTSTERIIDLNNFLVPLNFNLISQIVDNFEEKVDEKFFMKVSSTRNLFTSSLKKRVTLPCRRCRYTIKLKVVITVVVIQ